MNNFHKELITLLNDIDISFEHINNMEFEFSEVRFDDTIGVFYVKGYDTKDDSYEQLPLIELKLSPDEVVKSEDNKIEGEGYEYYTGRNEKIYVGRVISGRYAKAK